MAGRQLLSTRNAAHIPWWMFDIANRQLITTTNIPDEIKDSKSIVIAETVIPGRNYAPAKQSSNGNRKISFTLKILKRNNTVGNVLILKQFDQLRNQVCDIRGTSPRQFAPNPKVLYHWGTGSVPLVYFVSKCEFAHQGPQVNELGNPQYSFIEMELILDESDVLYKAEEMFRKVSAISGFALSTVATGMAVARGARTV
jgi:hypothetical protein